MNIEKRARVEELLESYANGNVHWVRQEMGEHNLLVSDMLYVYLKDTTTLKDDVYMLVRQLEPELILKPKPKSVELKDWLNHQGVNTHLFWLNCRPENQRWDFPNYTDREAIFERSPADWIDTAFSFDMALQQNPAIDWVAVSSTWLDVIADIDPDHITLGWEKE